MAEKTVNLPDPVVEDGQHIWLPSIATVITAPGELVLIDDTVCGAFSPSWVRGFALALLAAADVAERS